MLALNFLNVQVLSCKGSTTQKIGYWVDSFSYKLFAEIVVDTSAKLCYLQYVKISLLAGKDRNVYD